MTKIKTRIEKENCLLVVKVEGNLSTQEILNFASSEYVQTGQPNILWDLSESSVHQMKQRDITELAKKIVKFRSFTTHGKTAIIAQTVADFGIIRMYQTLAENSNQMVEHQVFYSHEEARKWLLGPKLQHHDSAEEKPLADSNYS